MYFNSFYDSNCFTDMKIVQDPTLMIYEYAQSSEEVRMYLTMTSLTSL